MAMAPGGQWEQAPVEAVERTPGRARRNLPADNAVLPDAMRGPGVAGLGGATVWKARLLGQTQSPTTTAMSASTMCTSCLRAARRIATHSARAATPSARHSITPARAYSQPTAPLYLDFLLPTAFPRAPPISALKTRRALTHPARRTLATTATPAAPPTRAILHPRTDDTGAPLQISISPRASHRLCSIAQKDANPHTALRVSIESGGCHGFQYLMALTDLSQTPPSAEDTVFEGPGGAKVVVDESSLELLNGSTVDYSMELIGSQFKVTGIPGATSSCGRGLGRGGTVVGDVREVMSDGWGSTDQRVGVRGREGRGVWACLVVALVDSEYLAVASTSSTRQQLEELQSHYRASQPTQQRVLVQEIRESCALFAIWYYQVNRLLVSLNQKRRHLIARIVSHLGLDLTPVRLLRPHIVAKRILHINKAPQESASYSQSD
ncbi:hypothetical protein OPT61_g10576 [Boeremia exigua]|uniref:Uncharacterized protein n=1 Tax=Boeremia exigua TaxID=749465 RepID=A0ACC2HP06_9PLEO|nr:hypothetical protein OPT61_g10576 [Boeremia exigua]